MHIIGFPLPIRPSILGFPRNSSILSWLSATSYKWKARFLVFLKQTLGTRRIYNFIKVLLWLEGIRMYRVISAKLHRDILHNLAPSNERRYCFINKYDKNMLFLPTAEIRSWSALPSVAPKSSPQNKFDTFLEGFPSHLTLPRVACRCYSLVFLLKLALIFRLFYIRQDESKV